MIYSAKMFVIRLQGWISVEFLRKERALDVRGCNFNGSFEFSETIETQIITPDEFELSQNYPNPFNPSTNIAFELPKSGHVMLSVFNLLGQKVATLIDQNMDAGSHNVHFDATNLPSGLYFYQLQSGNFNSIKKMVLLK